MAAHGITVVMQKKAEMPIPKSPEFHDQWFKEIQAYFTELEEEAKQLDPKDLKRLDAEVSQLKENLEKQLSECRHFNIPRPDQLS
jgi:molecular chaperone GrpE (heat shock protein)